MVHILNISQARNNLSSLVKQVVQTKNPVVIVQDSTPSVIMIPYSAVNTDDHYLEQLLTIKGNWFSVKDFSKIRKEVAKRFDT